MGGGGEGDGRSGGRWEEREIGGGVGEGEGGEKREIGGKVEKYERLA